MCLVLTKVKDFFGLWAQSRRAEFELVLCQEFMRLTVKSSERKMPPTPSKIRKKHMFKAATVRLGCRILT